MIAFVREENEYAEKHECEIFQMQTQMNLQMCQVLLQNMGFHTQQL